MPQNEKTINTDTVSVPKSDVIADGVTGSSAEPVTTAADSASTTVPEPDMVTADGITGSSTEPVATTASSEAVYTASSDFSSLIPIPKFTSGARSQNRKVRKSSLAVIMTSSPYKQQLTIEQQEKQAEMLAKNERKRKREKQAEKK